MSNIWELLSKPHPSITEENLHRRARLISGLGFGLFFALLIGTLAAYIRDAALAAQLLATVCMVGIYLLSRTRFSIIAGVLMVLIMTVPSFSFFVEIHTSFEGLSLYAGVIWLTMPIVIGGLILPVFGTLMVNTLILVVFLVIKLFIVPDLEPAPFWHSFAFLSILSLLMTFTLRVREVYLVKPQIDNLLRANRVKDEFLATMSHELRTPLNAIIGYSSLLLTGIAGTMDDQAEEFVGKISHSSETLLALISDILDISKIEAGQVTVTLQDVSLSELCKTWKNTFSPLAQKKGIGFDIEVKSGMPDMIHTDAQRLTQIVTNLITNAIKFTDVGEVSLSINHRNKNLILQVKDTGIGIPEEELTTIFDKFKQVDSSSSRKYEGTGLGLAITKRLITLFDGDIKVNSQLNQGSTFTISLPVY